jgi:hypothetical protein
VRVDRRGALRDRAGRDIDDLGRYLRPVGF